MKNNARASTLLAVVLMALIPLLSGCISSKASAGLVVGNATENVFRSAAIRAGTNLYTYGAIESFTVSPAKKRASALSEQVTVEWVSGDGAKGQRSVTLTKGLLDYPGRIQFQVDGDGVVKVFTAPAKTSGDSVLPWSMPANWEGAPSIPGMNQ